MGDAGSETMGKETPTEEPLTSDAESFPASDAPSGWSGPDEPAAASDGLDRVEAGAPVEEVPEPGHPAEPVPRRIPRSERVSQGRAEED